MADANKKRLTIGLIGAFTPELFKGDYFTQLLIGVTNALVGTPHDFRLILVKEEEYKNPDFKILDRHNLDGLILITWRIHDRYIAEALDEKKIPVVVVNDPTPGLRSSIVYCDNKEGVHLAMRHLLSRGYRKIGMLHAPDDASLDARQRYDLLRELLGQYQLTFEPEHYRKCDYFFEEDGYLKMLDMIHQTEKLPRAIICVNDDIAIGAIRALKENWIRVPDQVAVIGYDGIRKGKYTEPSLTTVGQPLELMGKEMVRILMQQIEKNSLEPITRVVSPELIIRKSC